MRQYHPRLPWLGVADHPLDLRELPAQAALEVVDLLMDLVDPHGGIDVAMEVDDLAIARLAHAHVVDIAQCAVFARKRRERGAHRLDTRGGRVAADDAAGLQRLDVALDL